MLTKQFCTHKSILSSGRFYHGDPKDKDQIGQVGMLLNGTGRYRVLWEDDLIKPEFGILAGVSKDTVKEFINLPTLSGRKRIDGRQLIAKAKASIKESKILLAYWTDFTKAGGYPSGKNEKDALNFCTESVSTEHEQNMEKESDDEEEEEENEEAPPQSQSRVLTQPLKRKSAVVDSDNDEAEASGEESDNDADDDIEFISRKKFIPPALVTFMLLGPYGAAAYGFDISAVFSVDTEAIDENSKKGIYNTKSMKEEKKITTDIAR